MCSAYCILFQTSGRFTDDELSSFITLCLGFNYKKYEYMCTIAWQYTSTSGATEGGPIFATPQHISPPSHPPPLSLNSSMMMIGVCGPSFKKFSPFRKKTVLGDYINALKKTLDFSSNSYQAVKQHGYK